MSELPYTPDQVGRRITMLRRVLGMKQSEFADVCGFQRGELAAWESGGRRPSIQKASQITARYPEITLDWLFLGDPRHMTVDMMERLAAAEIVPARSDPD